MYQSLRHRSLTTKSRQPFSICLDPIPIHEKVVYIDSVCAALIDSRFGLGRSRPFDFDLEESTEQEPDPLSNPKFDTPIASYKVRPSRETSHRHVAAAVRREMAHAGLVSLSIRCHAFSPSPLGRGSPPANKLKT